MRKNSRFLNNSVSILFDVSAHPILSDSFKKYCPDALIYTAESLGLDNGIDDATLIGTFCAVAPKNSIKKVVTKDRGRIDGVMPQVIKRFNKQGNNISTITYSPSIPLKKVQNIFNTTFILNKALIINARNVYLSESQGEVLVKTVNDKKPKHFKIV